MATPSSKRKHVPSSGSSSASPGLGGVHVAAGVPRETLGASMDHDTKYTKEDDEFIYTCIGPIIREEKVRVYFKRVEIKRKPPGQQKKGGPASAKKKKGSEDVSNTPESHVQLKGETIVYTKGQKVHLHAPEDTVYIAEIHSIYSHKNRPNLIQFEAKWFYAPKEAKELTIVVPENTGTVEHDVKESKKSTAVGLTVQLSTQYFQFSNLDLHPLEMLYSNHKDENDITMIKCPANVLFLPHGYQLPAVWPSQSSGSGGKGSRDHKDKDDSVTNEKLVLCRYRIDLLGTNRATLSIVTVDKIQKEFRKYFKLLPAVFRHGLEKQKKWWDGLNEYVIKASAEEEQSAHQADHHSNDSDEDNANNGARGDAIELEPPSRSKSGKTKAKSHDKIATTPEQANSASFGPEHELAMSLGVSIDDTTSATHSSKRKKRTGTPSIAEIEGCKVIDLTTEAFVGSDSLGMRSDNNTEQLIVVEDKEATSNERRDHSRCVGSSFDADNGGLGLISTSEFSHGSPRPSEHSPRPPATITELELCDPLVNLGHDHHDLYFEHMDSVEVADMLLQQGDQHPTTMMNFTSFPDPPSISPEPSNMYGLDQHQHSQSSLPVDSIDPEGNSNDSAVASSPVRKNWYDVVTVPKGQEQRLLELLDFTKKIEDLSFLLWYRQERVLPNAHHVNIVSSNSNSSDAVSLQTMATRSHSQIDYNLLTEKDFKFWKSHVTDDKLIPYQKIIHQLRKDYRKQSGSHLSGQVGETAHAMTLLHSGTGGRKRSRSMSLGESQGTASSTGAKMLSNLTTPAVTSIDDDLPQTQGKPTGSGGSGGNNGAPNSSSKRGKKRYKNLLYSDEEEPSSGSEGENDDYYFSSMTGVGDNGDGEETRQSGAAGHASANEYVRTTRRSVLPIVGSSSNNAAPSTTSAPAEVFTARDRECIKNSAIIPDLQSSSDLDVAKMMIIPSIACYQYQPEKEHEVNLELYFTLAMKEVNRLKRELLLSIIHPNHYAILSYDEFYLLTQESNELNARSLRNRTIINADEDPSLINYFGDNQKSCQLRVDGSMIIARGDLLHIFLQSLYKK